MISIVQEQHFLSTSFICRTLAIRQRWARIQSPATLFESGFEFSEKSRIRYVWYGVYRM